jgi:hypothetical protein
MGNGTKMPRNERVPDSAFVAVRRAGALAVQNFRQFLVARHVYSTLRATPFFFSVTAAVSSQTWPCTPGHTPSDFAVEGWRFPEACVHLLYVLERVSTS